MSGFNYEAITKIYVGQDRACRCGCQGTYIYRGEKGFDRRLGNFTRKYATLESEDGGNNINISYGKNRAITAYFD